MPRWPHDDTASLVAFYGDPRTKGFESNNIVLVRPPWQMTFVDGKISKPIRGVQIHRKCAVSLKAVFNDIWEAVGHDASQLPDGAVRFSGSYAFRPIRGSKRLSTHAFGAAIDLDAEHNLMNRRGDRGTMDDLIIDAFRAQGWFWGGDFRDRQDPMHFQAATEGAAVPARRERAPDDDMPAETPSAPPPSTSVIESAGAAMTSAGTIITQAKALWKSHISWGAVGLGTTATTTAVAAAPPTLWQQFVEIWKNPYWWLVILNLALMVYILVHYYFDHGKGALRNDN